MEIDQTLVYEFDSQLLYRLGSRREVAMSAELTRPPQFHVVHRSG
jgi:hypothetical protein